mmetsp:Transcript_29964/g.69992  ORF Transcript_29964/g.69992 Transcript_29964/m.69992 type:complete len:153 (+) Transcript_29964:195-653(+)
MLAGYDKYVPEPVKAQPYAGLFQLYGFDVMLDDELKPWLLEVNLDPALGTDSPLDFKVKSGMLVDALNLLGLNGSPSAHGHGKAAAPAAAADARSRLTPEQVRKWRALAQVNAELERNRPGGWHRLMPCAEPGAHSQLFEAGRDLNALPFAR